VGRPANWSTVTSLPQPTDNAVISENTIPAVQELFVNFSIANLNISSTSFNSLDVYNTPGGQSGAATLSLKGTAPPR
jgi:hypothetical protein